MDTVSCFDLPFDKLRVTAQQLIRWMLMAKEIKDSASPANWLEYGMQNHRRTVKSPSVVKID